MNIIESSVKFSYDYLKKEPLFIIGKELYIESNQKKNYIFISDLERKQVLQMQSNPQMFFIYTISTLVRSCIFLKTD